MPYVELVQEQEYEVGWQEVDVTKYVKITRVLFDGINQIPFTQVLTFTGDQPTFEALTGAQDDLQSTIDAFTT